MVFLLGRSLAIEQILLNSMHTSHQEAVEDVGRAVEVHLD